MKDLHIKHKLLIFFLFLGVIILSILFIWTFMKFQNINQEREIAETERYLGEEEVVFIPSSNLDEEEFIPLPVQKVLFGYVEVVDGCSYDFEGECLNVRSGPGTDYEIVGKLRNGIILRVGGLVERDDNDWYKIIFDEWIRYPERISEDWYISADYVKILLDEGEILINDSIEEPVNKRIEVSVSEQKLYAYENDELFMEEAISTGVELTPTPRGTFTIFKKTPSRYMQGPLPGVSTKYWDLPGVPWNLYFTHGGAVIHGTYWHDNFGQPSSNGCINIRPDRAEILYKWATVGTKVVVKN